MTSRERLMATLRGEPVDRPAVNFYEIGGVSTDPSVHGKGGGAMDPDDPDPFNVHNDPSWRPLLRLAETSTDLIRMRMPILREPPDSQSAKFFKVREYEQNGARFVRTEIHVAGRVLTQVIRRDRDVATNWCIEHLLKTKEDALAWLELPDEVFARKVDVTPLIEEDRRVGDRGIVMVDTGDPICAVAPLFAMQDFTVFAFTEREVFHRMLEKAARPIWEITEQTAKAFPGHLWRIYGPEYASEPYLPPKLFEEYVVRYTRPMFDSIRRYGGYPRLHCHGRIKNLLHYFVEMGAAGTDPIEPPIQGDVLLADVRRQYGKDLVLFGNIEATDLENMEPKEFEKGVAQSLRDGTAGSGKGFVLMPSASPYGRTITPKTMANYETMVRLAHNFSRS